MVSNIVLVGYVLMVSKANYTVSIWHYVMHNGFEFEKCNSCAKFVLFCLSLFMLMLASSTACAVMVVDFYQQQ
jgi:hypothetical protein